ncbi:MAG: tetratricopeptide repeat protein, partial [Krumholzibacteria bacterium]|nr:tetratricopeptide repeat protein [Candidatus Krumholzibacteria bacterium]
CSRVTGAVAPGATAPVTREQAVPTAAALWEAAGKAYAAGTDKSAAMQQYRLFVQEYGGSERAAEAQYMVGECYFAAGDYAGALREYAKVKGRKGNTDYLQASVLLREGECHYNLGDYDEAIARYGRLIDKYDDTFLLAEGLYEIGLAYIVKGNWLKLGSAYRELLERRPGYGEMPQVKFALGLFAYQDKDYETAIGYFGEVPSDRGLYYLGRCLEDTGQYILAIQRYRQVLRTYPDSPLADDAAFSVAEAFYRSGQNAVAVRSYREFIDQYPDSRFVANARYKMACVTFSEKRYDESVRQLEEIVRLFPGEEIAGYAQYLIGDCYAALDRRAEAIFAWTEAVRRFEGSRVASAAMHKIVFTYAAERNFSQAIVLAEEFLRRYPGDSLAPRVRVLQGFSHFELEEYRQAIMCFQNVVDKNVNTDVAERALFLSTLAYFRVEQLDRVITNYNYIASRLLPTPSHWRARTYYYLGEAYYAQGLYRQAEGMYRLVLTGYPRSNVAAAALQGLVASLSRSGDYELALREQEKFLLALANADSEKGNNSLAVGSIYFNQRKYEEALKQFSDFLAKHPDDPAAAAALANQGDCYYRLQYYDQAIESWRSLLTRFPAAPEAQEALYRIADTQFGLGRYADAAATYGRLQERYPDGARAADAAFGVANCAYNQGQDTQAIEAFGAFMTAYPGDPRVEDAELGVQSCFYRSGRDMEEYLATKPDSPLAADIYWNKGQDAFAAGDFKTAAKAFARVTLDFPGSESGPGALFYLAESYYRAEDLEPALAGYRNFTTTHPGHELAELAHLRSATVLFKQEKFAQAAMGYEKLVDLFPGGEYAPLAAYNAAVSYQEIEDWHAAIGGYARFVVDYPAHENARGLWLLVANLYQDELGDYVRAAEAYEHALAAGDATPAEIRFRQGECREKDGKLDDALALYGQAADTAPAADAFRIAALARLAEVAEDRGDWSGAIRHWQQIVDAGGKAEWTSMAAGRIQSIRASGVASG